MWQDTILEQLGGNRFISMTGAKTFVWDDNKLQFSIPRNQSKANKVVIIYKPRPRRLHCGVLEKLESAGAESLL